MIYREAAKYLDDGAGTLRNRIYNSNGKQQNLKQLKQVYALVSEALKYRTAITQIIAASQMMKVERRMNANVALVMVYDLLFGQKRLNCGRCPEKEAVLRHKTRLNAELVKYRLKHPKLTDEREDEVPVRWIRDNSGSDAVHKMFKRLGLTEVGTWAKVGLKNWYRDTIIPDLYAIHPSISMAKLPEYAKGEIIVQDRASCIPVTIMAPRADGVYIDSCAAPGNKTSQLAAKARKVYAFERDPKRAKTLEKMLATARLASNVEVKVQDFLQFPVLDEPIAGLIVDPSCSGSGIFRATTASKERLTSLGEFQYLIMLHALQFDAEKVVYSTCSIHAEEDEHVVKRLLETPEVASKWQLAPQERALPNWPRRGIDGLDGCIRVEPRTDGGIGFFAACFERRPAE